MPRRYFDIQVFEHDKDMYTHGDPFVRHKNVLSRPIANPKMDVDSRDTNDAQAVMLYMAIAFSSAQKFMKRPVLCHIFADHAGQTIEVWFVDLAKNKMKAPPPAAAASSINDDDVTVVQGPQTNIVKKGGVMNQGANIFM